jgi:hypothetical protein
MASQCAGIARTGLAPDLGPIRVGDQTEHASLRATRRLRSYCRERR